jgi:glycosyltransferase involved in cell wall biosynthesis
MSENISGDTSPKKIKILTLSDHPLSPSGVGTQTKYFIEGLLRTGKYEFFSLAGAMKHHDYKPIVTPEYGESWKIVPIDGYGNKDVIRSLIRSERPDVLWFMTDPRFWGWLWEMDNEIRPMIPMVYYHVWDNYPYPTFNKKYYDSNDLVVTISKVTDDIVRTVSPDVPVKRIGHVPGPAYIKLPEEEIRQFRQEALGEKNEDKMVFFWNNRNARRKQSGSLIYWFKKFLDKVGHDKAMLIMHTDPTDQHGQDLEYILRELGITDGQVMLSKEKLPEPILAKIYNMVDCTINISDAEGFGLATLESLACGTPILVNKTGGLQEQVTDGKKYFGIGLDPTSKAIIGSQNIPAIYEDRLSEEVVVEALERFYNFSQKERDKLGELGRQHVEKNYSLNKAIETWDDTIQDLHEHCGSWETRKNYKPWTLQEITKRKKAA